MGSSHYREDIDRLRGLAVLAVIAFHYDESLGAHGGYVGVDIFFVISGFLISQIIQREVRSGSFTFWGFYERRVRRLLPALYAMVAITIPAALLFLLPSERADFFRSVGAVMTFSANILFWSQAGYFDRTAVEKPLLHTWSLSVEEQFYLVLPLLIWAAFQLSRRYAISVLLPTLLLCATASFAAGHWFLQNGGAPSAFYMSPLRAWEFLIGSIFALEAFPRLRHEWQRTVVAGMAYVLILVPIFGLRNNSTFPGWHAFYPCLGAAFFIWSGTGSTPVTRHQYSPYHLFRFIGTISYSLYLWHWPLFAFARWSKEGLTLSVQDRLALLAVTMCIAYLSWRFVEEPFRKRRLAPNRRAIFATAAIASCVLLAISTAGLYIPVPATELGTRLAKLDSYHFFDQVAYRGGKCFLLTDVVLAPECLKSATDMPNVLLWGDSHAAHYYPGLAKLADERHFNLMQATAAGCTPMFNRLKDAPRFCQAFDQMILPWLDLNVPDVVILSGDWMGDMLTSRQSSMMEDLHTTVATLEKRGSFVVVVGPAVQFKTRLPAMLVRAMARGADIRTSSDMVRADIFPADEKMRAALPDSARFSYVSAIGSVCKQRECPSMLSNDVPLTWDYGHLTVEGSAYVIDRIPWPPALLQGTGQRSDEETTASEH